MLKLTYHLFTRFLLSIVLLSPGVIYQPVQAAALGATFTVNSTADSPDLDLLDGICLAINGACTIRAAIQQANYSPGADTINMPAGIFLLTRVGIEDNAVAGDLDITDSLTIQGAGSGVTIVDGNGANTNDRVFQILSTAKDTTIGGLTVRNGKRSATFDEGGGIYWDGGGGHLTIKNVTVENNNAYYGGGLYLNFSTAGDVVDLNNLTVHANAASAAAGGLGVNLGDFATLNLHDSKIDSNTAYEGGGVYFQGTLSFNFLSTTITNTQIFSNTASLSAGFENHSGNAAAPVILQNSNLYQNHATFYGGAIGNYGTLDITNTTLDSNTAVTKGGGIYNYEGGNLDIKQSTLSRNTSTTGGGIYSEFFIHNLAGLVLTNSTMSGNTASQDGGGIYADGGQIQLYNATIATNQVQVPTGTVYNGLGGGVYLNARVGFSAENSLIADNTHRYGTALPVSDDCLGPFLSIGFDLIEGTSGCAIGGSTTNIVGQNPQLSPLQNSPGSATQIQAPMRGSPAIDAGETPNCTDGNGAPILIDQRGIKRPLGGRCDIGAVEQLPYILFLPKVQK